MPRDDIAFLHTAHVHVATFDALLQAQAPGLKAHHVVDEALLADAQRLGTADPTLQARVHAAMQAAAAGGARQVVCTCSTLGALAEGMATSGAFEAARIDRALADRAVQQGPRVLVVVALASTLAPTQALLADSAARLQRAITLVPLHVDGAWAHFERGDRDAYLAAIAGAVRAHAAGADVVVLAQASMAAATEMLKDLPIDVLSSPSLGVAAAVERWRLHAA
ncbi:MAG: hypothetical protein RJA10_2424 [Pseudomonadota bacterium]|jgi:hypothetical protein